jgi:UDP-GlcNAc:undecaprenyl-phosphate GlcNAc-1-phosphate transferase
MVKQYLILYVSSFALALFLTPLLRKAAVKNGALDYPDDRKLHKQAVPRVGGIAIAISFLLPLALAYLFFRYEIREYSNNLAGLCIGSIIVCLTGLWDDLWTLSPRKKLIGQFAAVLAFAPFGFLIRELNIPFVGVVQIQWHIGLLLLLFWMVGIMNTINFVDGMDGLAAGITITISLALFVISVFSQQLLMAVICLIIAGSTLGFLRYNFHPASIFMGDCGAMFLGFILAAVAVKVLFQNPSINSSSIIPVLIFGLPILDTTWAIGRRLKRGESPLRADSFHTHHRLMKIGLKQRKAVLILYLVSCITISSGLIIVFTHSDRIAVAISTVMLIIALISITILGRVVPPPPPEIIETKSVKSAFSMKQ